MCPKKHLQEEAVPRDMWYSVIPSVHKKTLETVCALISGFPSGCVSLDLVEEAGDVWKLRAKPTGTHTSKLEVWFFGCERARDLQLRAGVAMCLDFRTDLFGERSRNWWTVFEQSITAITEGKLQETLECSGGHLTKANFELDLPDSPLRLHRTNIPEHVKGFLRASERKTIKYESYSTGG